MTLLVSWAGVDTHGAASMYIAADSRISWSSKTNFDLGRKVFAFANWPDILGYCGDVLFPSIVLNQIAELADAGLLFDRGFSSKQKFQAIVDKLNHLFSVYPKIESGIEDNSLRIIHCSREPTEQIFSCRSISWTKEEGWKGSKLSLPSSSDVMFVLGSGAPEFSENYSEYQTGVNKSTSRNVFHCFCDTLSNTDNPLVGGAPQLVGLIRKPGSNGLTFGVVYRESRYFLGAKIDNLKRRAPVVDWRNELFERCDGLSGKKLRNAQPQPDGLSRRV